MAGTDADDAGDAGDAGDVVHNMLPNFRENVKNVENTVFFSVFGGRQRGKCGKPLNSETSMACKLGRVFVENAKNVEQHYVFQRFRWASAWKMWKPP